MAAAAAKGRVNRLSDADSLNVLSTASFVAQNSRSVRIDERALAAWADRVAPDLEPPVWDAARHFQAADPADTAMYILVQDTLNFCFWSDHPWEVEYEGGVHRGYWGLTAALRRALDVGCPLLDAAYLENITLVDLEFILRGRGRLLLMRERLENLREVGRVLQRDFGGRFDRMIEAAGGSAPALVGLLARHLTSFDDRAYFDGREVFFYKRAQICVADLYGALGGRGLGDFRDIEVLTAFADYELPRVLRDLGILVYNEGLAARVDAGRLIMAGSPEEVEIRANTVWAVELLRRELARHGKRLAPYQIDWILWERSQREPRCSLHHRTLTIYY